MNQYSSMRGSAARYAPDGPYAFTRLALSLLVSTLVGAGMWAVIVVLPQAQLEFGVDRAAASLPYTVIMCTLAFATIALGRLTDRHGIVAPLAISTASLGVGFVLAGYAPNLFVFSAAHALIGVGAGTGFGPMMADISHWFVKRRGLAVVVVASGNYIAGTIWPLLMNLTTPLISWRATYAGIGLIIVATVLPLALMMRRRPRPRHSTRPRGRPGRRAPMLEYRRDCCWFCWFLPVFPAVWRCRCRRSTSSLIAAISATASRAAPKCCP